MASALQVHGRHGRLHVVVGHVGVVRVGVVTDARGSADGLRGHVHGLAHGLRGPEGQEIVHGVRGGPGPHHARGGAPWPFALHHLLQPRGHGCLVLGVVGARVGRVLVVGMVVGDHLGRGHGGGHGRGGGARVRVELVVQRRARPGRRSHHSHRVRLRVQLLLRLRRARPSAPAPAPAATATSSSWSPVDGVASPSTATADLVPENPADGADGGHVVLVADPVRQELVPDLPGEDPWVPLLVGLDVLHHVRGRHAGLGAADGAGQYGARLVVAGENFADAPVGHAQLARDVARAHAQLR